MSISRYLSLILLLTGSLLASGCQDGSTEETTATLPTTNPSPPTSPSQPDPVIPIDTSSENGNNVNSPLGINSGIVIDWNQEWIFVDAFKSSRNWISGNTSGVWDDGRTLDIDENGWIRSLQPNQVARTLMFWSADGHYPSGQYTVMYDGEGTLQYGSGALYNAALSQPGRHIIDVDASRGGIQLTLTATNPSNPVRNIRVIMPGGVCSDNPFQWCSDNNACNNDAICESFVDNYSTQIFHPTFLDRIKRYRTYRFMDWMRTNNSPQRNWTNRPKPTDARWSTENGVPVEVMVALANRLHADPWFTIPHLATDDYVRRFAEVVRNRLAPDLKVYIEHSNEVWNAIFEQSNYAEQRGLSLGLSTDPNRARLYYHSLRSVEIFNIFASVFAGNERLVRVMGSQASNPWISRQILEYRNAYLSTDALAIAPYFGNYLGYTSEEQRVAAMTVDDLIAELRNVAIPGAIDAIRAQSGIAREFGVILTAYEGGQHLVGVGPPANNPTINALFDAVNRDPRMADLYTQYLNGWRDNGGQLFVNYLGVGRYTRYGRWGSLEYQDQPAASAPKFRALMDFIQNNPQ